jgi:hypothetical protein
MSVLNASKNNILVKSVVSFISGETGIQSHSWGCVLDTALCDQVCQ